MFYLIDAGIGGGFPCPMPNSNKNTANRPPPCLLSNLPSSPPRGTRPPSARDEDGRATRASGTRKRVRPFARQSITRTGRPLAAWTSATSAFESVKSSGEGAATRINSRTSRLARQIRPSRRRGIDPLSILLRPHPLSISLRRFLIAHRLSPRFDGREPPPHISRTTNKSAPKTERATQRNKHRTMNECRVNKRGRRKSCGNPLVAAGLKTRPFLSFSA